MDILKAMTSEPAHLLRVDATRGRIAVGLAADVIAVSADPLRNIESLRQVDFVMKDGRVVRPAAAGGTPP
jgi:imidazolonepropionase-like amidohydrolase